MSRLMSLIALALFAYVLHVAAVPVLPAGLSTLINSLLTIK